MITRAAIVAQLGEVRDAIKAAREAGIHCLLPDVVVFEDEGVYFEIPLENETDVEMSELYRQAYKNAIWTMPPRGYRSVLW